MARRFPGIFVGFAALLGVAMAGNTGWAFDGRQVLCFDRDWRFHLGDLPGADKPELNASGWRSLDVPHDWSIEGPAGKDPASMEGPFDPHSPGTWDSGYLNGGIGWYRKTFTMSETDKDKRVSLLFDGVYMDSDVWLNGTHLGNHPYGYTSFQYDLTALVKPSPETNVLAVRVNVHQPCSRWYSGAGIYRHVWLILHDSVHLAPWGTYVVTPEVADTQARVRVRSQVNNDGPAAAPVTLDTIIIDANGKEVTRRQEVIQIGAHKKYEFDQSLKVDSPRRWSLEDPFLYTALSEVRVGEHLEDTLMTTFGIRTFEFTADKGFFLNGKHVPIRGVCNHHDLGCLGTAVSRPGIVRQLKILRTMGCNAIRTSHNPPAPELLELCDEMGFLVMDEAFDEWKHAKQRFGYERFFDEWSERDLVSMIHRDRNHPSIILWSIGNEIPEQEAANGREMAQRLANICFREDPTRLITAACHKPTAAVNTGFASALDVFGINYQIGEYQKQRKKILVASETSSALSTRGEYNLVLQDGKPTIKPEDHNQCTSYDLVHPPWGCTAETSLKALRDSPWVAGEFVWTGFDYIGEPTPFHWPSRSSYFGIVDLCGFPKDRYYLYQSQWTEKPVVHLLPHWNWEGFEGKEIPVWCFTNGESVELFLNGKSQGEKDWKTTKDLHLEWKVPYEPGILKAVAKKGGQVVAIEEIHTAGKPTKLILTPDRKEIRAGLQEDLSFVEVKILDKDGHPCPNADNKIAFHIDGPGVIVGVDNGDPTNHEPFKGKDHRAFHGLCLVVIQARPAGGEIHLSATVDGLESHPVALAVTKAPWAP